MARQSFRLRRPIVSGDTVGVGSFVRGTSDLQATAGASSFDQDSAIRSNDIISVVATSPESVFEAIAIEYNAVLLDWTLTEAFSNIADIGIGESGILNIAIVYSKTGYPQTVTDGKLIYQGTDSSYLHQEAVEISTDQGIETTYEPETGKWAYYSLFAYFNSEGTNGTYYYQLLAQLEIIVPKDYGSRSDLWKRIPAYYREQDIANDNQLERYIDTFGFELDRTRTLIDTMMVQYDPLLAEAEAVEELATMLGLELNVSDVGVSRTRALLHDIGYLRKNKGTLNATTDYITAVSGGDVTLFTGASAPYYTFAVHSERANLIADPRFAGLQGTTWDVVRATDVTRTNLVTNPNFETNSTGWTNNGALVTVSRSTTDGANLGTGSLKVVRASNGTGSEVTQGAWNGSSTSNMIPVTPGDSYYLSVYVRYISGVTPNVQHGVKYYTSAGVYISETNSVPSILSSTTTWSRKGRSLVAPANAAFASIQVSEIVPVGAASSTWQVDSVLLEKVSSSSDFWPYFDGTYANTWSGYTLINNTWNGTANASTSTAQWYLTAGSPTISTTPAEGITITAGTAPTTLALVCKVGVPVEADRSYYMSADLSQVPNTVYGGYWSSSASWSDWSATTAGASVPVGVDGRYGYQMNTTTAGTRYPVFLFKVSANQSVTLSRWMVEPNKVGQFFDGDTVFGGFLYQGFSSDYLWSGTDQASYSTYTTNRQRTQDAIERLLPQILPVTMLGTVGGQPKYQVMFDWIPGKTL